MATADQIKALIRSHLDEDIERFITVALQMAAHEAQQGHGALAHDIRTIIEKAKAQRGLLKVVSFPKDLRGLVLSEEPATPRTSLVLPETLSGRIGRVIHEYRQQDKLKSHGLSNRRKILLVGPPGTGKTMTAQVLAHELRLPLHTIQVDKLVTKFMGETAAKLRQIFELIQRDQGVYLFDEFDAIGGERSLDNDVGEMRRVLNAFLQFIEHDTSDSLIVAATNTPDLLDRALFRRFDDILEYELPSLEDRRRLFRNGLSVFLPSQLPWKQILRESDQLSHAEIVHACLDAVKQAVLEDQSSVSGDLLRQMLTERRSEHGRDQG